MAKKTWRLTARKLKAAINVPDETKAQVHSKAERVLAVLRRRLSSQQRKRTLFNRPVEITGHWTRSAFYFSVTYESARKDVLSSSFRSNVARIEYNADGTYNLGFPMRRGWTATCAGAGLADCLAAVQESVSF